MYTNTNTYLVEQCDASKHKAFVAIQLYYFIHLRVDNDVMHQQNE